MKAYYKWPECEEGTGLMEIDLPTKELQIEFFDEIISKMPDAKEISVKEYKTLIRAKKALSII